MHKTPISTLQRPIKSGTRYLKTIKNILKKKIKKPATKNNNQTITQHKHAFNTFVHNTIRVM